MPFDHESLLRQFDADQPLKAQWDQVKTGLVELVRDTGDDLFGQDRDTVPTAGVVLARRLSRENRSEYTTILRLDRSPDQNLFQKFIILGACCVVENELRDLLET